MPKWQNHLLVSATKLPQWLAFLLVGLIGIFILGSSLLIFLVATLPSPLKDAKQKTAKTQILSFYTPLRSYNHDFGKYPTTEQGLKALLDFADMDEQHIDHIPFDPWRNPYIYRSPGLHSDAPFEIESYGPDGRDGGGDDIESWNLH